MICRSSAPTHCRPWPGGIARGREVGGFRGQALQLPARLAPACRWQWILLPECNLSAPNRVPNFIATSNLKGKLEITFVYNANVPGTPSIVGCTNRNDTSYFRFWLKDKANNRSDTVRSPDIVLIR